MRFKQFLEQTNGNGNGTPANGNGAPAPNGNGEPVDMNGSDKNSKMSKVLIGARGRFVYGPTKDKCPKGFKWDRKKGMCIKKK